MEKLLGIGSIICLVALLLLGLAPWGATGEGTLSVFAFQEELRQESERRARLQWELDEGEQMRLDRTALLEDFRAGRIGLDDLMNAFQEFNERRPLLLQVLRYSHPDHTDEEYLGYQVLTNAHGLALEQPAREALIRDLIGRLHERLGGKVFIPQPQEHLAETCGGV